MYGYGNKRVHDYGALTSFGHCDVFCRAALQPLLIPLESCVGAGYGEGVDMKGHGGSSSEDLDYCQVLRLQFPW